MTKCRPAYKDKEDQKDFAGALEILLNIIRAESQDPGEIRQGLASRWAQLKKNEGDAYEVFKHEWEEIMLDFEEFSKVPLDTGRFDKIRDMFTNAGER